MFLILEDAWIILCYKCLKNVTRSEICGDEDVCQFPIICTLGKREADFKFGLVYIRGYI